MGFEGANVLFDTWVHPLMMGLEEHLIGMFRGDTEFHEDAAPSHLGRAGMPAAARSPAQPQTEPAQLFQVSPEPTLSPTLPPTVSPTSVAPAAVAAEGAVVTTWGVDAEKELKKIPFFVRGKAKRNTELYARERGVPVITVDTLYDAKAHFSR
jgi:light-independent protochlorophyllide reductase subunit B